MAKIALFFLLDRAVLPENYGMKLSVEATAPLQDTISRDISLTKLAYTESTAFCLRFFKKPFNKDVLVIVKDLDYHTGGNLVESCCKQAAQILEYKGEQNFYHEEYLYRAMWLPRGVQKHEFETLVKSFSGKTDVDPDSLERLYTRGSWIMDHPDGYIFGSKNEPDFLRSVIYYSLAMVLHYSLSEYISRLSLAMATRGEQLPSMLREVNRFNGTYYFRNPVKPAERKDVQEYAHLSERFHFDALEATQSAKMLNAGALINLQERRDGPVPPKLSDAMTADARYPVAQGHERSGTSRFSRVWLVVIAVAVLLLLASALLFGTEEPQLVWQQWLSLQPAPETGLSRISG